MGKRYIHAFVLIKLRFKTEKLDLIMGSSFFEVINLNEFQRFFASDTSAVAKNLLGCQLLYRSPTGVVGGMIVETEAYFGTEDPASFAYHGKANEKSKFLYGSPGTIFAYQMYGNYLLDVITMPKGDPQAIMIRAIQPIDGTYLMYDNRAVKGVNITNGPGKLTEALGFHTRKLNGTSFESGPLTLTIARKRQPQKIVTTKRMVKLNDVPVSMIKGRFFVAGNPYVSTMKKREVDTKNLGWK